MNEDTDWNNFLNEGETIVWQGRPDAMVGRRKIHKLMLTLGLFTSLLGVACILSVDETAASKRVLAWVLGLLLMSSGVYQMIGHPFLKPYLRSKTWYSLTNRRAMIVIDWPVIGRRLRSFPITSDMPLFLESRYKSGVFFAARWLNARNRLEGPQRYGFELIKDAEEVHDLMREMVNSA